jgi:hypothetical protein
MLYYSSYLEYVQNFNQVKDLPVLRPELVRHGYSSADIAKILGGKLDARVPPCLELNQHEDASCWSSLSLALLAEKYLSSLPRGITDSSTPIQNGGQFQS